jgi:hypothetical protein
MLLEAVLTVVIVSICLTFITQSLLTNFRNGVRFQETIRSFIVMENRLGLLYATDASGEDFDNYPKPLEKPYDQFTSSTRTDTINDHLKNVTLKLDWPSGQVQNHLDVATIIYNPNES